MKNLPLKNKIIIALAAVVILVAAFFASGTGSGNKHKNTAENTVFETTSETKEISEETSEEISEKRSEKISEEISEEISEINSESVSEAVSENISEEVSETVSKASPEPAAVSAAKNTAQTKTAEKQPEAVTAQQSANAQQHSENTAKTCTFSVSCATILDNIDNFDKNKLSLLPADGVIFAPKTVTFEEGESVFDVLLREMRENNIHMEFSKVPAYNSVYIEGINNIYEFDCGELSGWEYRVNGEHPRYGCDMYKLKDGDVVEWLYTCDLGRDIGDTYYAQ